MFKKNISRFISIIFIVLISVGLTSGIGSSTGKLKDSASAFKVEYNVGDLTVKSKSESGFSNAEINALKKEYGEENVDTGTSYDVYLTVNGERRLVRLNFYDDISVRKVNKYSSQSSGGADSTSPDGTVDGTIAVYAERADNGIKELKTGDEIILNYKDIYTQLAEQNDETLPEWQLSMLDKLSPVTLSVTKIVGDPRLFSLEKEPSLLNDEDTKIPDTIAVNDLISIEECLYVPTKALPFASGAGDVYISFASKNAPELFTKEYESFLNEQKERVISVLSEVTDGATGEENIAFISLYENFSFKSLYAYADKIFALSLVLVAAFSFITVLVTLSNMTRLVDEERAQSACLVTLGYSGASIVIKYILFALTATVIGGVIGYFVGTGLSSFIYLVFDYSFVMPKETGVFGVTFFAITFAAIVICAVLATASASIKTVMQTPADLLRPKSPKPGKKVIVEKIPFIWNRLSFKYKSTVRNVLRYASRFIMTVIAVAGSMGLVAAGLALLDMCLFGDFGNASIAWLAVLVVVFAALLTFTAVYTITNISISERNREIATLMVLGYFDNEVTGYIYREIYIDAAVGIVFGYGAAVVLIQIVFAVMGFGSLASVSWYVWLISPVLVLLFTFIVTLCLSKKITSVDMNASLKALE